MPKTSLEKSHSKSSNAKLTLLSLFTILFFSLFWVSLTMIPLFENLKTILLITCIASGVLSALGLVGFNLFKR